MFKLMEKKIITTKSSLNWTYDFSHYNTKLDKAQQNEPVLEILILIAYASSEGSDEPVHLCTLARALAAVN